MVLRETYEAARHCPIAPRQLLDSQLTRQGTHDIKKRYEAWRFHYSPSYLAGDIEAGAGGGFTHWIPIENPLGRRNL